MKNRRKFSSLSSSTTTTVTFSFHNDHSTPTRTKEIPVECPPSASPPPVTAVHNLPQSAAAKRIQSAYRSHMVRSLYKRISSVNREANRLKDLIQRQETVDAIRSDDRERIRMNEALMALLLTLDSVPGLDPTVREARRKVSRMIVGMQEILDGISEAKTDYQWCSDRYDSCGNNIYGWPTYWEEASEEEMCTERGGEELERFCAQYLGFRCLERFLRE